jgi:DNA-directed RNA polymerase subunit RPC12/RpoP
MTDLELRARQIGGEIRRDAMNIRLCSRCGKILMYWVTIKGKAYCEQCAHKGWEEE